MKRFAFLATAAATLAIPAGAMAASTGSGVVLSVHGNKVEVVNASHVASAYSVHGKLPHLKLGSKISFALSGHTISGVRALGATKTISYYAHVVKNSSGHLVLRLPDGNTVSFASSQIKKTKAHASHAILEHAASSFTLTVNAPPGTTVLVTETVGSGGSISVTITIEATTGGGGSADQTAEGIVTDVQQTSFGIVDDQTGNVTRFTMDADALASVQMTPCDIVVVSYSSDGSGPAVADNVDDQGSSDAGACDSDGTYYDAQDETGPITGMSNSSITIDTDDQGPMTFPLLPAAGLINGYLLGDQVDVTYSQDPDGTLYVTDVEYIQNESTGVVEAVSRGSLTIVDDSTGQQDVFTAAPSARMFNGVGIGDQVDVTWHPAAGGASVVDSVNDLGTADPSGDDGN